MSTLNERCATGIAGLDEILNGGLITRRLFLVDGDPGAGKTTFALQFLLEGLREREKCLYITLSETAEELRAGARSHGWSLEGIEIIELIADEDDLDSQEQLTMLHPSETELTETTRKILEAIQRINPQRVVFDSLSEMRLLAQNSLRYRRQILALKQFFVGRRCTVLMLDDRTAEGPDMRLHSIAHGVIALESTTPAYGRLRRQLRVLKFRGTGFLSGLHDFIISRGGLTVFPRLVAADHYSKFEQGLIASGVARLDALLGGGAARGTSTLLVGPPGCGKSTIAIQYAVAAAQRGEHATAFLFDETKGALLARSAGIGIHIEEGRGAGQIELRQIDPAEISPGEFASAVRNAVELDGARVIVIDSLNGYLNSMPQDNYLNAQLHELLSYLSNKGATVFLVVAQSGLMGNNMLAPIDASYLADCTVVLRYFEHAGSVKKVATSRFRSAPMDRRPSSISPTTVWELPASCCRRYSICSCRAIDHWIVRREDSVLACPSSADS